MVCFSELRSQALVVAVAYHFRHRP